LTDGTEIIGENWLTSINWLRLAFVEPKIRLPIWGLFDQILIEYAQGARSDEEERERRLGALAKDFMAVHCSAYRLADSIERARIVTGSNTLNAQAYQLTEISSGRIADFQQTYGIRIDFASYWRALTSTPTKWETGDSKTIIARSAWGSTHLQMLPGNTAVISFQAPIPGETDTSLFGTAAMIHLDRAYPVESLRASDNGRLAVSHEASRPVVRPNNHLHLSDMIWRGIYSHEIMKCDVVHLTFNSVKGINETLGLLYARITEQGNGAKGCCMPRTWQALSDVGPLTGDRKPHEAISVMIMQWGSESLR